MSVVKVNRMFLQYIYKNIGPTIVSPIFFLCGDRAARRTALECVLTDVAAVAGEDAEVLRRDAPPAADGAAEGGQGGVAAALHHLLERQLGVAQQVARHLHVPVQAQLGEGQAGELMDGGIRGTGL